MAIGNVWFGWFGWSPGLLLSMKIALGEFEAGGEDSGREA
jgi:hypothetical protein